MNVCLDFDGVVTANTQFFHQLSLFLALSGHNVYILTAANTRRKKIIRTLINDLDILYDEIIFRPENFVSSPKSIGEWKKTMLINYKIDLWFDNEIKAYEQAGVKFDDIKTEIVRV